jgi:bifunctional DNA-binding transcriptional regulator/antitoxin component of YhaV-PrlF toxin-antitoxin module
MTMALTQFKLPIGAKRQVTIPRGCMDLLALHEGSELLLEVKGDHATLRPVVSVVRSHLPPQLRKKFEARRGRKSSDIPLAAFLGELANQSSPGPRKSKPARGNSPPSRMQAQSA